MSLPLIREEDGKSRRAPTLAGGDKPSLHSTGQGPCLKLWHRHAVDIDFDSI